MNALCPKLLARLFEYRDGALIWKPRPLSDFPNKRAHAVWNRRYPNTLAGTGCRKGYRQVRINGRTHGIHRLIWAMFNDTWPTQQIDHINGDPTDNRIENLREVSHTLNCRNKRANKNNTSGFGGVYWSTGAKRWRVVARDAGTRIFLGQYATFEEAVAARQRFNASHGYTERHGLAA